jgi:PAS domain S-box-containing protein
MWLDIQKVKGKVLIPPKGKRVPSHSSEIVLQELRNNELISDREGMAHSRDRQADLFQFIPACCLVLDSKGIIDEINLAGAALLGGGRNKFLHQPFSNFVVSEDADLWLQFFRQAKLSDRQQSCELVFKRVDGTTFHAGLDVRHADTGGVSATFVVLADISERKRREKETMEWRNEMAELRKMQIAAQTATAIAHELNQPLLAIASYSEAALTLLKDGKPELNTIVKAINGCERQAHRAGNTIHELLDFLSLKEIPAAAFDLNKTISDVVNTARLEHELQFDFILSLEDRLPLVFANRFHIEKALFNLLRNGIEAMHEAAVPQPAITVTVCTKIGANVAQVTIQDNGPGIREEHLHLLFKPFFTTKPKGIGMGLAVSRSLIEANGGQLWIDPAEGAGATFHLTLPFAL